MQGTLYSDGDGTYTLSVNNITKAGNIFDAVNSLLSNSIIVGDPPNTSRSVSIFSPADGETISGLVGVQIDASDAEDAAGSLTVEWNVGGGNWQEATYNSTSGRYEAAWDTTTVILSMPGPPTAPATGPQIVYS